MRRAETPRHGTWTHVYYPPRPRARTRRPRDLPADQGNLRFRGPGAGPTAGRREDRAPSGRAGSPSAIGSTDSGPTPCKPLWASGGGGCRTSAMVGPPCPSDARCVGYRPRRIVTLMGDVRLERHGYHGSDGRSGHSPWDELLALQADRLSPAARRVVRLAGVTSRFAASAGQAPGIMAGLRQGESSAERVCASVGAAVGEHQPGGKTFGPDAHWSGHTDADGRTRAAGSADATGVPRQGPGGGRADGRMAYVGMVDSPVPRERDRWARPAGPRPDVRARYVTGLAGRPHGLATPLRAQGRQVGMDAADRWLAISGGGVGPGGLPGRELPPRGRDHPGLLPRGRATP